MAIARKLLRKLCFRVIWHVLTAAETDRRADADKVAGKLMLWVWQIGRQQRPGHLTPGQFIRFHLLKLGLGDDLDFIVRGGVKRLIPAPEQLKADRPDLFAD